ncbi:hypothetical protein Q7C36_008356 [Tachysurus vachellii]|uniref:Uncharacterized protein n=1 Tax=Tachysurus vachellii TaxID=175792 RepID=A0AA88SY88_TACVA|nr:hypothetical protein Q7C36_008356 [Tachysurus vachellii]
MLCCPLSWVFVPLGNTSWCGEVSRAAAPAEMSRLECASSRLKSGAGAGHVISDKRCDQRSSLEEVFSRSTGFSTAAVFSQVCVHGSTKTQELLHQ